MTLEEMESSKKIFLDVSDVSELLSCNPNTLRDQAHTNPTMLGFPVIVMGSRVKIPRAGFLHFMKYGHAIGG